MLILNPGSEIVLGMTEDFVSMVCQKPSVIKLFRFVLQSQVLSYVFFAKVHTAVIDMFGECCVLTICVDFVLKENSANICSEYNKIC